MIKSSSEPSISREFADKPRSGQARSPVTAVTLWRMKLSKFSAWRARRRVEDGGAKNCVLGAQADGGIRVACAMGTHQEHDPANLRKLPQNALEQYLAEVTTGAGHEEGLAREEVGGIAHDPQPFKDRQRR